MPERLAGVGCFRPILLKKSAMVSTAEKYALKIEFFNLSRGFRLKILRSWGVCNLPLMVRATCS